MGAEQVNVILEARCWGASSHFFQGCDIAPNSFAGAGDVVAHF
jgi:hypothetical protein